MMGSQFIDLLGCFLVLWLTGGFTVKFDSDDQMDVIRVQGCSAYSIISYHRSLRAIKINPIAIRPIRTNTVDTTLRLRLQLGLPTDYDYDD